MHSQNHSKQFLNRVLPSRQKIDGDPAKLLFIGYFMSKFSKQVKLNKTG